MVKRDVRQMNTFRYADCFCVLLKQLGLLDFPRHLKCPSGVGDSLEATTAARFVDDLTLRLPFAPLPWRLDLDDRAVDQRPLETWVLRVFGEDALEHALPGPAPKAHLRRHAFAEMGRPVISGRAGAQAPKHGLKKQPA